MYVYVCVCVCECLCVCVLCVLIKPGYGVRVKTMPSIHAVWRNEQSGNFATHN